MNKLKLPSWLKGTMHLNYDDAPNLTLPSGKVAAVDTLIEGLNWIATKGKGFTHRHTNSGVANAEKFWTILASELPKNTTCTQDGSTRPAPTTGDAEALAAGIATAYTAQSIITDEFTDGSSAICNNVYWATANAFYSKLNELFAVGPETNNIFGGYMEGQNNLCPRNFLVQFGGNTGVPLHPFYVEGLASQANARKVLNQSNQTYAN